MDGNYSLSDIAAVTGNNRNGGMFGGDGDWGAWIILFLLFGMFNGRGFGGFGGFGGGGNGCGAPCATQADVRAAVDQQTLISKLDQQTYGIADATYALSGAIKDCCCTTQRAIDGVNFNIAKGFCDIGNVVNSGTRDILENNNANTRAILDFLTNDKIATLTAENQNLKLTASQANQNAVLMAAMDANKAEILRRTGAECPTPAYVVQPPTPVHFPYNNCGCGNNYAYGYAG